MRPTGRTRVFAVLGNPVSHSLSPKMQNAAFLAAGLDATYVALAVEEGDLAAVMGTLAATGGGGNITIPHKRVASAIDSAASARVQKLGVANLFGAANGGGLALGNTDVDGVLAAHRGVGAPDGSWLILGTGGSARAVAGAALERGVAVAVRSRDAARAEEFLNWAASIGVMPADAEECTVAINATPLGLREDDSFPLAPEALGGVAAVIDLTYRANGESRWVLDCRKRGLPGVDGREVLLAQGAASWDLWFPGVTPPVEVMRAALDGRLD